MIKSLLAAAAVLLLCTAPVFARGDFVEFQRILDEDCSKCHTRERIEQAMQRGENLDQILEKMRRFGAQLSAKEQQVLGVFWESFPGKEQASREAGPTVTGDPLGEYRAVLESRCTGCHSLDRVEKAMLEGRSVDELVEMMRRRGAIVTEAEQKVLGTFWGKPFKQKKPETK